MCVCVFEREREREREREHVPECACGEWGWVWSWASLATHTHTLLPLPLPRGRLWGKLENHITVLAHSIRSGVRAAANSSPSPLRRWRVGLEFIFRGCLRRAGTWTGSQIPH